MTVAELIEELKKYPQDLQVILDQFSDYITIDKNNITVTNQCVPRPDGVIQASRPDKSIQPYLYIGPWDLT